MSMGSITRLWNDNKILMDSELLINNAVKLRSEKLLKQKLSDSRSSVCAGIEYLIVKRDRNGACITKLD